MYYNDESKSQVESIANKYNCDFLNIENKGYSYGNNAGIKYATDKYDYEYIIISNPDIIIKKFDTYNLKSPITAPCIIAKNGKYQNPAAVNRNRLYEFLLYNGLKHNDKLLFYLGVVINKITREIFLLIHKIINNNYIYIYIYGTRIIYYI